MERATLPSPGIYQLDTARSELRVLVYKAGALSNLGHNHVVVNRGLMGSVVVGDSLAASSFDLSISVGTFVVDDVQVRQEEGSDFPGDLSEDAKAGTLHNMLSSAVLDAAAYPEISAHGVGGIDAAGAAVVTLDIDVAGHHSSRVVPLSWHSEQQGLSASGSMQITQTSLGLTPYSLMMGALQVRDTLQIKFRFVALP